MYHNIDIFINNIIRYVKNDKAHKDIGKSWSSWRVLPQSSNDGFESISWCTHKVWFPQQASCQSYNVWHQNGTVAPQISVYSQNSHHKSIRGENVSPPCVTDRGRGSLALPLAPSVLRGRPTPNLTHKQLNVPFSDKRNSHTKSIHPPLNLISAANDNTHQSVSYLFRCSLWIFSFR